VPIRAIHMPNGAIKIFCQSGAIKIFCQNGAINIVMPTGAISGSWSCVVFIV